MERRCRGRALPSAAGPPMRSSLEARGASHSFGLGLGFGGWSRKFLFLCRRFSSSSGTDCWNASQAEALGKGPGDGILPPFNHPKPPYWTFWL